MKKNKFPYIIRLVISIVVLITAILAIWGIYPVHIMDIQLNPLLQRCLRHPHTIEIILLSAILIASEGTVASILGVCGDLSASVIKRNFGKKDYGTFFPGHGGIMDRFDSTLFALPTFYIFIIAIISLKAV